MEKRYLFMEISSITNKLGMLLCAYVCGVSDFGMELTTVRPGKIWSCTLELSEVYFANKNLEMRKRKNLCKNAQWKPVVIATEWGGIGLFIHRIGPFHWRRCRRKFRGWGCHPVIVISSPFAISWAINNGILMRLQRNIGTILHGSGFIVEIESGR